MAKAENQKQKILFLLKILWEKSDEMHPVSMKTILKELAVEGIEAERKSIYSDLESLRKFGFDIEMNPSKKNGGYYLASRVFELPELKILVDMIQASRFITEKKSRALIAKLEKMTDCHEATELQRTVFVSGRAKSENESVFYSVDDLHRAISIHRSIRFQYQDYDTGKEVRLRKNGEFYHVSPYHLVWNNEFYYLVGVDESRMQIRHYRVDRMKQLTIEDRERVGEELFEDFDLADYIGTTFGMFGGKKQSIRLLCENSMAGIIIDRFGKEIELRRQPDREHFSVRVDVVISEQFFGWLSGLGKRIELTYPSEAREAYLSYLQGITQLYIESK
ncbi:MAG: helix-turn-helix transcriptional regulator [Lachnospiraceae bacterium]